MNISARPLAVVTGVCHGIGLELARLCAKEKFDLIIAADEPLVEDAAEELTETGVGCQAVRCDLSSKAGVDQLLDVIAEDGRPVAAR